MPLLRQVRYWPYYQPGTDARVCCYCQGRTARACTGPSVHCSARSPLSAPPSSTLPPARYNTYATSYAHAVCNLCPYIGGAPHKPGPKLAVCLCPRSVLTWHMVRYRSGAWCGTDLACGGLYQADVCGVCGGRGLSCLGCDGMLLSASYAMSGTHKAEVM
eukprot:2081844-Rhodomonas_salina.2